MTIQYWNGSTNVTPKVKLWDGSKWADVGGNIRIKSRQSGTFVIKHYGSNYVNINTIDPSKSILRMKYESYGRTDHGYVCGRIHNSTQLDLDLQTSYHEGNMPTIIYWEVTEFEGVKSKHVGKTRRGEVATIPPVDVNKSFVETTGVDTGAKLWELRPWSTLDAKLKNSTTVEILPSSGQKETLYNAICLWQVIEFE